MCNPKTVSAVITTLPCEYRKIDNKVLNRQMSYQIKMDWEDHPNFKPSKTNAMLLADEYT